MDVRLGNDAYDAHRGYVLAVLSRRCGWLDPSDREAAFHDAYVTLLEKERGGELDVAGMHARQVRAYLTLSAVRRATDEGKRAERRRGVPLAEALSHPAADPSPEDRVMADMDSLPVREIVAELPPRRQAIVKLRVYFNRSPEEIQRFLGIGQRIYRREVERAMWQIAERYEIVRAGRWCESRRSLVLAYVAGVAGPGRVRAARAHLGSCSGCMRLVAELRGRVRSLRHGPDTPTQAAIRRGQIRGGKRSASLP